MTTPDKSPYDELDIDETLKTILEGTSSKVGKEFFKVLVFNLAKALDTYAAWITELESAQKASSIAFIMNGKWVKEYVYDLKNTPCEPVIMGRELVHIPDNVVKLYPKDPDLITFDPIPLSYMGIPLIDSNGSVLGHLAVMDSKPMPENPRNVAIMNIFAARALAEMQRLKAEAKVLEREKKHMRLLSSAMDAIAEFDEDLKITQVNRSAEKILGSCSEVLVGTNYATMMSKASLEKLIKIIDKLEDKKEGEKNLWIPAGLELTDVDGNKFQAEATISQLDINSKKYYTLIFRNVTHRIEAEKKIESLSSQAEYLKEEIKSQHNFEEIIGKSKSLQDVINNVKKVSTTNSTVLIYGETGTGKELIARLIHAESKRSDKPLIKVNCAAIPAALIESEFFGHEKGAFTGATSKREGRFLIADGGTIFLDEIGELPLDLQSKLLRVLQEGEFEPVGTSKTIRVDVRIIAATNRDLLKEVESGNFREDLYYRLNVFPITVPPLRERGDDVITLAEAFCKKYAGNIGVKLNPIDKGNIEFLKNYRWPGNIRELQNVIERAVITSQDGSINLIGELPAGSDSLAKNNIESIDDDRVYTVKELSNIERDNILRALEKTGWKISGQSGAANLLGIPPTTLNSRIKALNIKKPS